MKDKLLDTYWKTHWKIVNACSPYYYRFFGHKHHIIKTKLTPAVWYDSDMRILYGVMAVVEYFVENDMQRWTRNEYEDQIDEINKSNRDPKTKELEVAHMSHQYNTELKIMDIYYWWKNYPNRLKEIEIALHNWSEYVNSFCKGNETEIDGFIHYLNNRDTIMNDQEKQIEHNKHKYITNLEMTLEKEEQDMLKQAIELRKYMWS